ncbi:hypothetical protein Pla52o_35260 [Novipirellula galeiformis]|uniref:Uncharacterized protein n=1 Tax=Novipirellula galeiformis TaxID=2528004 RepID=A0A5C6CD33_9BACT|nr:hypothetical protein [Novipirellula galeiformis]TWU22470.1 hypothetical protein Pla52o_35260 [Novipirellula galeiformis]
MSEGAENAGWVIAGVSTVVATLASAVAGLFKLNESKNAEAIKRLEDHVGKQESKLEAQETRLIESDRKHDECQQDRIKLSTEVGLIRERLASVERDATAG